MTVPIAVAATDDDESDSWCRTARVVRMGLLPNTDASVKALHIDALCQQQGQDKGPRETVGQSKPPHFQEKSQIVGALQLAQAMTETVPCGRSHS